MKKIVSVLLIMVLALGLLTGCGEEPAKENTIAEESSVTSTEETTLEYELASKDTPISSDFSCVISKSGEVQWQIGETDFGKLAGMLSDSSEEYQCVEVLPDNDNDYPYLYPKENWKMYIMDESIADWFDETAAATAMDAFAEWKQKVYGIIDTSIILGIGDPQSIEVSENSVTDEVQALLDDWYDVDEKWMTCNIRNSVQVSTRLAVGESVANDAWNYIYDKLWTQTAEDLAGHSQVDLISGYIGSAFVGVDEWEGYVGVKDGYPFASGAELLKSGYIYMDGLFSAKVIKEYDNDYDAGNVNKLVKITEPSPSLTGSAFACVVDENLNIYWKLGIDYCSGIIEEYNLGDDVASINFTPDSDLLYNGESYFEIDGSLIDVITLGDAPSWYENKKDEVRGLVESAFKEWQAQLNNVLDINAANNMLMNMPVDAHTEMNEEIFDTFKEWVTVWNEIGVSGYINTRVTALGWESVGVSSWNNVYGVMSGNYKKRNHKGCPGPTTDEIISSYAKVIYGKPIDSATGDFLGSTMNDSFTANIGYYISGLERDSEGKYKYQSAVDLWEAGCIPFYDGVYWYLVSGPDGDVQVIYSATNDQLMDESFEYR